MHAYNSHVVTNAQNLFFLLLQVYVFKVDSYLLRKKYCYTLKNNSN